MTAETPVMRTHGNAYNIFILVLTIYSLALMVLLFMPLDPDTRSLVTLYDNAICVIFLIDFAVNLAGSRPRRAYFISARGWLDLLGSIPTLGFIPFTVLFRLARLSRLSRITRLLGGQNRTQLIRDVLANRSEYATFITLLLGGMVLSIASILVLQEESRSPDANIKTGGDAIWWGIVTITTVGYGDFYPVTFLGRLTAGVRDARRHRHHRRPGQHPRERAGRAGRTGRTAAGRVRWGRSGPSRARGSNGRRRAGGAPGRAGRTACRDRGPASGAASEPDVGFARPPRPPRPRGRHLPRSTAPDMQLSHTNRLERAWPTPSSVGIVPWPSVLRPENMTELHIGGAPGRDGRRAGRPDGAGERRAPFRA